MLVSHLLQGRAKKTFDQVVGCIHTLFLLGVPQTWKVQSQGSFTRSSKLHDMTVVLGSSSGWRQDKIIYNTNLIPQSEIRWPWGQLPAHLLQDFSAICWQHDCIERTHRLTCIFGHSLINWHSEAIWFNWEINVSGCCNWLALGVEVACYWGLHSWGFGQPELIHPLYSQLGAALGGKPSPIRSD